MKITFAFALLWITGSCLTNAADRQEASHFTRQYSEDTSLFPNPERGFWPGRLGMPPGGGKPGNNTQPHPPFKLEELRALRSRPEGISLVRDCILLGAFLDRDISEDRLAEIQADFDVVRAAGLKSVPRILYHWGMVEPAPDPDEGQLRRHLAQLGPIFRRNADVIAFVEAGNFGGTGEPNSSQHGYVIKKNGWQYLSNTGAELYRLWLRELPIDRMMDVRFGRMKWSMFGWDADSAKTLTYENAFDGSDLARVGFHNDSFLGHYPDHYSTFQFRNERHYVARETSFVPNEGEVSLTSRDNTDPETVLNEMAYLHKTGLTLDQMDAPGVYLAWKKAGIYDEIARRLGYRLRLVEAEVTKSAAPGGEFRLVLRLRNDGFARVLNPRLVEIVLRHGESGQKFILRVQQERGNRLWFPGPGEEKRQEIRAGLPKDMPEGEYSVLLNLPDPYPTIHGRPEYCIRLANQNTWESLTGMNNLQMSVSVAREDRVGAFDGTMWFARMVLP